MGISAGYYFVVLAVKNNKVINEMQNRHLLQQKRSAELERNLFKTRNAYLAAQINPHLLFNTLSFICSCLYEVSEKAANAVMLLSDMMRYSLADVQEDGKVELLQEIEHIDNMIQLNQARFNDKLQIKTNMDGDFKVRIIPLILLTFIENIFKHGDLNDPNIPAQININYYDDTLHFLSTNKIRRMHIANGAGIGIENSKTRLDDAYHNRYTLSAYSRGDEFVTELVIKFEKEPVKALSYHPA